MEMDWLRQSDHKAPSVRPQGSVRQTTRLRPSDHKAPSVRPQGSVSQTTRLRQSDHKAPSARPQGQSANSKHWFTTSFLQECAGKRCSECGRSADRHQRPAACVMVPDRATPPPAPAPPLQRQQTAIAPAACHHHPPPPPQPESGMACYVVMTAGCDGPQNRVRFCCRCNDE